MRSPGIVCTLLVMLFLFLAFTGRGPTIAGNYGPVVPPSLPSDPAERVVMFIQENSEAVSTWTRSSLENYYIDLSNVYNTEGSQFLAQVQDVMTSLQNVGIHVNEETLPILDQGWEAFSYVKEIDPTFSDFNSYVEEILNCPGNQWTGQDTVKTIVKDIFSSASSVPFGALVQVVEEIGPKIENGIPNGDRLLGATIQILDDNTVGTYDPINHAYEIGLSSQLLGEAVLAWDNGILSVDVSDVALLPVDLKVGFEPDVKAGCLKINVDEAMVDLGTLPLVGLILDVNIKAGTSGEIVIRPDPDTSIDKQVEVTLKGVHAEAGLTAFGIPVAKAELAYYLEEEKIYSIGEAGGVPVWAYYDDTEKTWRPMASYFMQVEKSEGYCITETSHFSIFTVMSSNDPAIHHDAWNLFLVFVVVGSITVVVAVTAIFVLRRKKK